MRPAPRLRSCALLAAFAATAQPCVPAVGSLAAQSAADGREALRSGDYDAAERAFRGVLREDPRAADARARLVETLLTTGRYDEAVEVARAAPDGAGVPRWLGLSLRATGDLDGAEAALRRAVELPGPDRLAARADLADLLARRGRTDEAHALFDSFIDVYNGADGRLSASDLVAVGRAVHWLGRTDPALFQDALMAFDRAAGAAPDWPEPRILAGELFLEKYQSPQAHEELAGALALDPRHPRALLAEARALEFDGAGEAAERAREALEVNPSMVEARAFLAGLELTREGHAAARELAEEALEIDPSSLEALAVLAAAHFLEGDQAAFARVRDRALAIHPTWAGLDARVARLAEQVRRYASAVERARAAVQLDPTAWEAWGVLGMNQLRTGDIEEGRASLERAFAGDPYNPWFKNNLDLLDTFERYQTVETDHFRIFVRSDEAELLAPLVADIAEEAYDSLSRRYGVELPGPQRVELFPSHADFSVRTLGEVGLGALGVSFGPVLVMDSPAARERGQYNWASTLWHELAHSFHLAMTDHRVPRWFSEGLAVHEQRRGRQGWGHQPTFAFLRALQDGRLKKVSELNDGFMRPDYPQQVIHSYYQASLVFELFEERYGDDVARRFLDGYRRGRSTADLFERVVGTDLEDFDDEFDRWIRDRFDAPLAGVAALGEAPPPGAPVEALESYLGRHPGDLVARLRLGAMLVDAERYDEARPHLQEVMRAFPSYGGPDSPYLLLARIHRAEGDDERAAAALARLNSLNEVSYGPLLEEAELNRELGNAERASWALDRAVQIHPYDPELHARIADLAEEMGDTDALVRARRAVVALDPPDRAQALYLLARAHLRAGDRAAARSAVLEALDLAPNYEEALELLLELRGSTDAGAAGWDR